MRKKAIQCIFVDTEKQKITLVSIQNNLDTFHEMLKCRTIDIVTRKVNNVPCDFIVDDEALFKEVQIPSVVTFNSKNEIVETIMGNCLIANHDDEGDMISLTTEQIEAVTQNVLHVNNGDFKKFYQIIEATI